MAKKLVKSGAGMFVIIFVERITRFLLGKPHESLPVEFRPLNCGFCDIIFQTLT